MWLFEERENWFKLKGTPENTTCRIMDDLPVVFTKDKIILGVTWLFQRYKVFVTETNERVLRKQIVIPMFTNMMSTTVARISIRSKCRIDMIPIEKDTLVGFWETAIGRGTDACFVLSEKITG